VRMGAVDENFAVSAPEPQPVKVFAEQDDISHLKAHLTFLTSPMFGANPLIGTVATGPLMEHVKDHMISLYKKHASAAADSAFMTSQAMGQPMTRAQAEAAGAAFADQALATLMTPLMPILEQAQKQAAQFAPKPPVDPTAQAQIAAAAQTQQATLQAQAAQAAQVAQAQAAQQAANLAAQAQEADKDRAFKLQMKQMELDADAQQAARESEQNDRATVMATAVEKHTIDVQQSLEQFKADSRAAEQERENQAVAQRQQMKADADAQLMILSETLKNQAAQIANAQTPPVDVAGIITPLVEAMQTSTAQMMQQLSQGLAAIHQTHSAPRIARYIKDEMGNNIGVESIPKV
jgi:hypothetical protein